MLSICVACDHRLNEPRVRDFGKAVSSSEMLREVAATTVTCPFISSLGGARDALFIVIILASVLL